MGTWGLSSYLAAAQADSVSWRDQFVLTLLERDLLQWRARAGDEGRLLGAECKRADAPCMTKSVGVALADLDLERIAIVYPCERRYPPAEKAEVVPLDALAERGKLFAWGSTANGSCQRIHLVKWWRVAPANSGVHMLWPHRV